MIKATDIKRLNESLTKIINLFSSSASEDKTIEIIECPECHHYMPAIYFGKPKSYMETQTLWSPNKLQDCYNCDEMISFRVGELETMTLQEIEELKEKKLWHDAKSYGILHKIFYEK